MKVRDKILAAITIVVLMFSACTTFVFASVDEGMSGNDSGMTNDKIEANSLEINAKSAVLMEAKTGIVLFSKNASEGLPPASVTKIMTLLLICEAIDEGRISLDDKVLVSANAASKGGSQIYVKEGEEFTVEELLKSTAIASANDAAVALAELVSGTEEAFVEKMNSRAVELGMINSHFENSTGLDDSVTEHYISAYDVALMSRELIKHPEIIKYSSLWQDSIRNGEFTLTNTNRLVRYYEGCTGLKTGSTDKAGFCLSATAERDGMHLIAVVMGSESRDTRNEAARAMLDYGFSNYTLYSEDEAEVEYVKIKRGEVDIAIIYSTPFYKVIDKGDKKRVVKEYVIPDYINAPIQANEVVGRIIYKLDNEEIGSSDIFVKDGIERINTLGLFCKILKSILVGKC